MGEFRTHKAWVVAADMGYGHQRAAYPLANIAHERIINANAGKMVLPSEKRQWMVFRFLYEGLSRATDLPLIGPFIFRQYDRFQRIDPFYPWRDRSAPNFGVRYLDHLFRRNFLRSLVEYTRREERPFIATFFAPALAAAHWGLPEVYCVVTDSDINRVWVPLRPGKTRITYLAPTERAARRLVQYGVPEEDVFFTGFPLPGENLGGELEILKADLGDRLPNLDPGGEFLRRQGAMVRSELGASLKERSTHPFTITFSIGGAGAQRNIGAQLLQSLKGRILEGSVRLNLIAGTHLKVSWLYTTLVKELGLEGQLGRGVYIQCTLNKGDYFRQFNDLLHTTDVLWAKPSELSFYTALGIPFLIAPPMGAHERHNERWLLRLGAGIPQEDPRYADQWLFDWRERGELAEAAWNGYLKAPKNGTRNIKDVVFGTDRERIRRELGVRRGNIANGETPPPKTP